MLEESQNTREILRLAAQEPPQLLREVVDGIIRIGKSKEEVVKFSRTMNCHPHDGQYHLGKAFEERFALGGTTTHAIMGMFGPQEQKPFELTINVGPNGETATVPSGRFSIVGTNGGWIETSPSDNNGFPALTIFGEVQRQFVDDVNELIDDVEARIQVDSIFRGNTLKVILHDQFGDKLDQPIMTYVDPNDGMPFSHLVFSKDTSRRLRHYFEAFLGVEPKVKRSVALVGAYGVGKTEELRKAASIGNSFGWTVLYAQRPQDIVEVYRLGVMYAPSVVIVEDIDRAVTNNRDDATNELMNVLDGIDTKGAPVFLVATTNHPEAIPKSVSRKGRFDVAIEIETPDAGACEQMLRNFCGDKLRDDEDVSDAAETLAGRIPAEVAEVAKRAMMVASMLKQELTGDFLDIASQDLLADPRFGVKDEDDEGKLAEAIKTIGASTALVLAAGWNIDQANIRKEGL